MIAYIDGFNFYYGLRDAKLRSSLWLDLPTMCQSLLQQGQNLELVRYFTTRVRNDPAAGKRQSTFIELWAPQGWLPTT